MQTPAQVPVPAPIGYRGRRIGYVVIAVLATLFLLHGARRRAFAQLPGSHSISVNGTTRSYLIHVPPGYSAGHPVPLVIVMHGATQPASSIEKMSGMDSYADKYDFIAVYPEGTGRAPTWNAGACCGFAQSNKIDDVGFIRALIAHLEHDYSIDPRRIYATGISNGAMMSYRLGCELADRIAAIAPVEGAQDLDCKPSEPVSVVVFHGTADRLVPYNGGSTPFQIGPHRTDTSVESTVEFWVEKNGCLPAPEQSQTSGVHISIYSGCVSGTGVVLYAIQGGRHDWPGSPGSIRMGIDGGVNATDVMWKFFAEHPKQ